jgi:hypothetical protein
MITILILYTGGGALMTAISIPLIQKRIPPNLWYGFRVRRTLENPDVWYAVNAYAGVRLFWAGIFIVIGSVALYLVPGLGVDVYTQGCLAVSVIALATSLTSSWRYLQSYKS